MSLLLCQWSQSPLSVAGGAAESPPEGFRRAARGSFSAILDLLTATTNLDHHQVRIYVTESTILFIRIICFIFILLLNVAIFACPFFFLILYNICRYYTYYVGISPLLEFQWNCVICVFDREGEEFILKRALLFHKGSKHLGSTDFLVYLLDTFKFETFTTVHTTD